MGLGLAWGSKGPGPDRLGLGGQGSWAGRLGGPRVLGRTGLAWGAKGPGPDRLGLGGQLGRAGLAWGTKGPGPYRLGLGGQGSWAGPAWFLILRRSIFKKYYLSGKFHVFNIFF